MRALPYLEWLEATRAAIEGGDAAALAPLIHTFGDDEWVSMSTANLSVQRSPLPGVEITADIVTEYLSSLVPALTSGERGDGI